MHNKVSIAVCPKAARVQAAVYCKAKSESKSERRCKLRSFFVGILSLAALLLGCNATSLLLQPTPTPVPTRAVASTFTPTPEELAVVVVVTPPEGETPGVIIVPSGADIRTLVPPAPTATHSPTPLPTETSTETATPLPTETATETPITSPTGTATETHTPTETPTPTETHTPTETPTPTETNTPTETPTLIPTITPTPYAVVQSGLVSLRTGPGVQYPLIAQLGPNLPITIVGQNDTGSWVQLCCVSGGNVWVAAQSVQIVNDIEGVLIPPTAAPPPPTPTVPPLPPTATPTATPYVFANVQCLGPERAWTANQFLTIYVKLSIGSCLDEAPAAEGYFIKVLFEGFEREATFGSQPSQDGYTFQNWVNPALPPDRNAWEYNYKYEYHPPDLSQEGGPDRLEALGTGIWTVWVVDGSGNQLSNKATFRTEPRDTSPDARRAVYIHWQRIR